MRWPCLLFLFFFYAGAADQVSRSGLEPSSAGATVSVRGTVVDALTGKTLDAVHVMFTFDDSAGQPSVIYGAMSNAQGRFSISNIPPGDYSVVAEKRGFIFVADRKKNNVRFDALRLRFKAGERPDDLVLPMVPRAIIAGRVLDAYGDPLINAQVTATSVNREPGAYGLTNGRGEFRLSVRPGKYYVEGSKWSDADTAETPISLGAASGYVHTYYPGTTGIAGASPVEALAGRVVNGVEFRLLRPAAFRVSGEITGLPEGNQTVSLWWKASDSNKIMEADRDEGRLDFRTQPHQATRAVQFVSGPLDAGTYYTYAVCCEGNEELLSQIAEVTLVDSDVTGITLALAPAAEITGTIAITGGPVVLPGQGISVRLQSESPLRGLAPLESKMDENSSFRIGNVFPGRYRLEIASLLEDAYISSVELNGSAVHGNLLDFFGGAEGAKLKILVSHHGARMSGQVRKIEGDAPLPNAQVLLFPEHEGLNVDKKECQNAYANETGIYSFQHLAPGRYRLVAMPPAPGDQCEPGAAAMRHGLITAESIELKSGETVKDVRVVDEERNEPRP